MIAIFTADPVTLIPAQMDAWVRTVGSWDVCDGCMIHLFRKSPHAWDRAFAWSREDKEFVRRAGFAMFATLAVHDKRAIDETFAEALKLTEEFATDERNFVKKAINWALRSIGKRNPLLRAAAIDLARRLAASESASARWIGADALRELSASSHTRRS